MKYLTLETILAIHDYVIAEFGGTVGVRDIGRLESAVASQHQAVFGHTLYITLHEKAAVLIRSIIQDHPFIDGNKRTGLAAGLTLLELNGIKISFKPGEIEDFAVYVSTKNYATDEITEWLIEHSKN